MKRIPLSILWIAFLSITACKETQSNGARSDDTLAATFQRDELTIRNGDGNEIAFDVYLAVDFEQQRRGLMFVRSLPERTGMLFVYDEADFRSMWMKNTYLSLDLIFARGDGTVSSIVYGAEPLSLESRASTEPVNFVLELPAGSAHRHNIRPGSRIIWDDDAGADKK